jgi:soluble lytic murein transglycosylase-like protein
MVLKKSAWLILYVFFGFSAACVSRSGGALSSAAEYPPLPVPRPAQAGSSTQEGVPPEALAPEPDQALRAKEPGGTNGYRSIIKKEAEKNGLPPDIADAVAAIESGYDPAAVGTVGEIGLMQVRPETALMLGFKGDLEELARPDVNIHYGVTYLSQAWRLAGGDLCRTLMKYRAGHGEEVMSPLSVIYCGRARAHLAEVGSPFAASASVPFVYGPPSRQGPRARRGPPRIRTAAVSRAFWAAEEARVKAITKRIEAKWRKVASR